MLGKFVYINSKLLVENLKIFNLRVVGLLFSESQFIIYKFLVLVDYGNKIIYNTISYTN